VNIVALGVDSYLQNVEQNAFKKIYRAKTPPEENPKFEYRKKPRGPKQTERLKSQLRNPKRACLEHCNF